MTSVGTDHAAGSACDDLQHFIDAQAPDRFCEGERDARTLAMLRISGSGR